MTKEDLKQIAELLDEKLDEKLDLKFKENNIVLTEVIMEQVGEKIDAAVNEIAGVVNSAFSEFETKTNDKFEAMDRRFDRLEEELSKKPSRADVQKWADENLIPYQRDVDKLKFLHLEEWKNLPDNLTIASALVE